ncbi:alpha/beta hydrolase fold domain-containing protein [Virgibacillus xinjiangensis]|uniref:Alpha/beta hydrolase fold domain-containing protein n=1 Tax=Virgibacillus xinjiangensis TaxID=393090 RepID=A0ABV7CSP4_9BACI
MTHLDESAKEYLKAFTQMPAFYKMDPPSVREMMAQAPPVEVELAPVANVEERRIPVGDGEKINARVYTPAGEGPFPIIVYYHGGGWVLGDLETADATCRLLANHTEHVVINVDYRLSPEHPFPTPLNDAYAAYQWARENSTAINGISNNIIVGGDSAGGNLATAVTMKAKEDGDTGIQSQLLIYPVTDLGYDTPSYEQFQEGYGLDRELMKWFGTHYIRGDEDRTNPYVSPLKAPELSGLPPAFVATAENDVLRDEGKAYAKRLKDAGVDVTYVCENGLVHGYFTNMIFFADRIKKTVGRIGQFLKKGATL